METVKINLTDLKTPDRNVRLHPQKQIEEFARSIEMFGQLRPIVTDENHVILCGNGLAQALVQSGHTEADCHVMKNLTENQKKKLMIADNKIFSLGIEDLNTFEEFIQELSGDLDIPGFDEEILQAMVASAEEVTEKISTYGTLDEREIESIKQTAQQKEELEAKREAAQEETPIQTSNQAIYQEREEGNSQYQPDEHTVTPTQKSVKCPHCGEEIWL